MFNFTNQKRKEAQNFFDAGVHAFETQEYGDAAEMFGQALEGNPDNLEWRSLLLFSVYLGDLKSYTPLTKKWITECLKNSLMMNVGLLIRAWAKIVIAEGDAKYFLEAKDYEGFKQKAEAAPDKAALFASDLVVYGLKLGPIPDVTVERLLTWARRLILEYAAGGKPAPAWMEPSACALAHCCFSNEYVFSQTKEEEALVEKLTGDSPLKVAAWAMYRPLTANETIAKAAKSMKPLAEIVEQQINEPEEERQLRKTVRSLKPIEDETSKHVQVQYEENPYPRWTNIGSIFTDEDEIPLPRLRKDKNPKFLIGGCATGRYPIGIALLRQNYADVKGIDISLTSIGYALRMMKKHKVNNLELVHADILDVGLLGETFDVVETLGVVHHMRDPAKGVQALVGVLKPEGYIKIAVYSKLARRHITECQEELRAKGFQPTLSDFRRVREYIIGLPADHPYKKFLGYDDFYTSSMIRDLLLPAHENFFTIGGLKDLMRGAGLKFLGFVNLSDETAQNYKQMFPVDPQRLSLENWQRFEEKHPDTFIGMYKFWCEREGAPAV
jgi:SAM-dependent methyltransferase